MIFSRLNLMVNFLTLTFSAGSNKRDFIKEDFPSVSFANLTNQLFSVHDHNKVVACFFNSHSYKKFDIEAINGNLCTHLIYKYAKLDTDTNSIAAVNETLSKDLYDKMNNLKKRYKHLKILIAVGGSHEDHPMNFNHISKSSNRKEFTNNALAFLKKHKFDGLHLHWNFPTENDKYFVDLGKELKEAFRGEGFLLTTTMGGKKETMDKGYDVFQLTWTFDLVFIIAYGFHSKSRTNHTSPLYSQIPYHNINDALNYLFIVNKANPNSAVLGIPFYGDLLQIENVSTSPFYGFNQPTTKNRKVWGYGEICDNILSDNSSGGNQGWRMFWDEEAKASFGINGADSSLNGWLSFNNPQAIYDKVVVANRWGMRGIMVSSIDYDDYLGKCSSREERYPLLNTINYALTQTIPENETKSYFCGHLNNQTEDSEVNTFRVFDINKTDLTIPDRSNLSIYCVTEGDPTLTATWLGNHKEVIEENGKGRLHFKNYLQLNCYRFRRILSVLTLTKFQQSDVGNYYCEGRTASKSNIDKPFKLHILSKGRLGHDQQDRSGWFSFLGLLVVVFCLVVAKCTYDKYKTQDVLTDYEVRHFREGAPNGRSLTGSMKVKGLQDVAMLAYDPKYEIDESQYEIDKDEELGAGAFGVVYRGKVLGEDVAVKTIKCFFDKNAVLSMLAELKIMIHLQQHPNIINLVAAHTSKMQTGMVYVFVEFCPYGNLLSYLRTNRTIFTSLCNVRQSTIRISQNGNSNFITEEDLLNWSIQIAKGLEYLKVKKVVHSDLAARNVLVFSRKSVKLTDFGLSRKLYINRNYTYQKANFEDPLPWRWMAIESLVDYEWSYESDVWSFGVTLWEIFSLGQVPYSGLSWNEEFIAMLKRGKRTLKPEYATNSIYKVILQCCNMDPKGRPTPNDLQVSLEEITNNLKANQDNIESGVSENQDENLYENLYTELVEP